VARQLRFGCSGCPDNCCDSYFLHHTSIEWAYLWQGMRQLSPEQQREILHRAAGVVRVCQEELTHGRRPVVMCPLNEHGLCVLYPYRLLVCRTHGVPAVMTRPDGKRLSFPGCFRCQEVVRARGNVPGSPSRPDQTAPATGHGGKRIDTEISPSAPQDQDDHCRDAGRRSSNPTLTGSGLKSHVHAGPGRQGSGGHHIVSPQHSGRHAGQCQKKTAEFKDVLCLRPEKQVRVEMPFLRAGEW